MGTTTGTTVERRVNVAAMALAIAAVIGVVIFAIGTALDRQGPDDGI